MRNGSDPTGPGPTDRRGASADLLRHSLLLVGASQIGNVLNAGFHALMGRRLPADEYGILYAMVGLTALLGLPLAAIHNAVTYYTAQACQEGRGEDVGPILRRWAVRMGGVGAAVLVAGLAASGPLARFYQLEDLEPLRAALVVAALMMVLPVASGGLLGQGRMLAFSGYQVAWPALRLAGGAALIALGTARATAGLWGHAAALVVTGAGAVVVLARPARAASGGTRGDTARPDRYLVGSLAILLGFGLLANADAALVKRYFEPALAGQFAMAATIARIVVFLPQPIATALFPRVVAVGRAQAHHWPALRQALLYVSALTLVAVIGCSLLPGLPLRVLYGIRDPSPDLVRLVRVVAWAMSPLAPVFLLVHFELAQARYSALMPILLATGLFVGGVALFHASLLHVAVAMGTAGMVAILGVGAVVRAEALRGTPSTPGA